ncbi:spliceosomal protein sap [Culex quinquefasciatus]|uniref:Spliceosomal protein sap n=1 Tax=Culex quinquefasciatus TaxID=7176 RepID=B0W3X7_CULQU|nr:spliceosomal protein sap [Culex quinquefasciatus]|eukprot:XP_001843411.1 spliceosomal protein sap [Culex quinquefasciatus]
MAVFKLPDNQNAVWAVEKRADDCGNLQNAMRWMMMKDVIKALPENVQHRVNAFKQLQNKYLKLEAKFFEEVYALECKYQELYQPLGRRKAVITGESELGEADRKKEYEDEVDAEVTERFKRLALNYKTGTRRSSRTRMAFQRSGLRCTKRLIRFVHLPDVLLEGTKGLERDHTALANLQPLGPGSLASILPSLEFSHTNRTHSPFRTACPDCPTPTTFPGSTPSYNISLANFESSRIEIRRRLQRLGLGRRRMDYLLRSDARGSMVTVPTFTRMRFFVPHKPSREADESFGRDQV